LTDEFGVDPVRYYLLRETSLGNDGDFSHEGITARYNTDLANNLGNLVARVTTIVATKCAGVGPAPRPDSPLATSAQSAVAEASAAWERFAPNAALEATWGLIGATNAYLEQHAPWKMQPGEQLDAVMGDALEAIRLVSVLATPAIPQVCATIWSRIGLEGAPGDQVFAESAQWGLYRSARPVVKGEPLFPRIKVGDD
jgi:methionyl-tRNA synthetase